MQLVTERVQAGESLTSPAAQEELKTFLAQNSDLTEAGIDQQVRELGQQLDETQQQVAAGAEQAAGVSGLAALGTSAALLVGALIAARRQALPNAPIRLDRKSSLSRFTPYLLLRSPAQDDQHRDRQT